MPSVLHKSIKGVVVFGSAGVTFASGDYDGAPALSVQISPKYHQSKATLNHILAVAQAPSIAPEPSFLRPLWEAMFDTWWDLTGLSFTHVHKHWLVKISRVLAVNLESLRRESLKSVERRATLEGKWTESDSSQDVQTFEEHLFLQECLVEGTKFL